MMIRNILWDIDGTLFDTYPAIIFAISKSLNSLGFSLPLNNIDKMARQSVEHCLASICQRFKLDSNVFDQKFVETYRLLPVSNQVPFPGVRETCIRITQSGGVNIAVTHRGVESTCRLLEAHNLLDLFAEVFSSEQGYPRKPDPAMLLAAMQRYGLQADETLLVGDRDLDIQAGRAAGIQTCFFGREELSQPASFQIEAYSQLLQRLNEQNGTGTASAS